MLRSAVVQSFLDLYATPSYLEIGVNQGETFQALTARRKVAVDPKFLFAASNVISPTQSVEYHEVPSDRYFGSIATPLDRFDVVYVDGLHTFEQTLRDVLNAIAVLKPGGAVIVDDVIPSSYHAALPDLGVAVGVREFLGRADPAVALDGSWMGDVFKIPFFVETFLQAFSYATVAENHGQMVMWREPRAAVVERGAEAVARLEFKDTVGARHAFRLRPLAEIVAAVAAAKG